MAFEVINETVSSSEKEGNRLGLANSVGHIHPDESRSGGDLGNNAADGERFQKGRVIAFEQRNKVGESLSATLEQRSSAFQRRVQGLKAIPTVCGVYTRSSRQEQQKQPFPQEKGSEEQGASQEHAHRHTEEQNEEERPAVIYRTVPQTEKPSEVKQEQPSSSGAASERASSVVYPERASAAVVYRTESKQAGNLSSSLTQAANGCSSVSFEQANSQVKIEPPEEAEFPPSVVGGGQEQAASRPSGSLEQQQIAVEQEQVAVEQVQAGCEELQAEKASSSVGLEQEHTAPSSVGLEQEHTAPSSVGLEQEHTAPSSVENQERALVIREEHMQVDGQCGVLTPERCGEAIQTFVEPETSLQVLDWNKTVMRLTCTCSACPWSVLAVGIRSPMTNTLLETMVEATLSEFEIVPRRKLVNSVEIFAPPVGELCAIIEFTSEAVLELFLQACSDSPFCTSDQKVTFIRNFCSMRKADLQQELAQKRMFSSLVESLMVYVTGLPKEWCCEHKLKDYFDNMVHELKVVKAVYTCPGLPEAYIELYTENAADLVFYRSERDGLLGEIGRDVRICRGKDRVPLLQSPKKLECSCKPAGLLEGESVECDMEIDSESETKKCVKDAAQKSLDDLQNPPVTESPTSDSLTKAKQVNGKVISGLASVVTGNCESTGQVAVNSENAKVVRSSSSNSSKGGADAALDSVRRGACGEGENPGVDAKRSEANPTKGADVVKGGGEEVKDANNTKTNNDSGGGSTTKPVKVEEGSAAQENKLSLQIQKRQQKFAAYEKRRDDNRYDDEEECSRRPAWTSFHSPDNIFDRKIFVCKMNSYDEKGLASILLKLLRRVLPDADDDCIIDIYLRPEKGHAVVEFRSPSIVNKLMTAYTRYLGDVCVAGFPMCIYRHKNCIRPDRMRAQDDPYESEVVEIHGLPEKLRAPALQGALTELFEAKLRSNHGQSFFTMFEFWLEVVRVRFYSASVCKYLLGLETFEVDGKTFTLRPESRQKRRIEYAAEQEFKRNRHAR